MDYSIYIVLAGIIAGIVLSFLLNLNIYFVLLFLSITLFLIFYKKNNLVILFLIFFCIGVIRVSFISDEFFINEFYGREVDVVGEIIEEPKVKEKSISYVLSVSEIREPETIYNLNESLRITLRRYEDFKIGTRMKVKGTMEKPENFETESGREFDYVNYLKRENIYGVMIYPEIEVIDDNGGSFFVKSSLFKLKGFLVNKMKESYPSPHAELLAGVILGVEESLGDELLKDFRKVGLVHIVVLSGYNVMIIIIFLNNIARFLPIKIRYLVSILFIILFAIMTGSDPPVVRASTMAVITLFGAIFYKSGSVYKILSLAIVIMILSNPYIVLYDLSFQLSVIATFGIISMVPICNSLLRFIPNSFDLRNLISTTVSAQIAVLPLLAYAVGTVSLVALIVNLLVLPIIPLIMLLGFIGSVLSIFHTFLGFPFNLIANLLISYCLYIVNVFANLKFSEIILPEINSLTIIFVYFTGCLFVFFIGHRLNKTS